MNGNIDGTIELVVTKIASLQDLLVRLQSFKAELGPMAPAAMPAKPFGELQRAVIPTKAAMPRVNGKPRPRTTSTGKPMSKSQSNPGLLLKTCAELPQPFTAEQVARAIHEKDVGKVSSALSYHVRLSKKLVAVTRGTSHGPGTYRMANVAAGRTAEREQSRDGSATLAKAPANGSRTWLLDSALKVSASLVSAQFATSDVERVLGVDKKRASNWLTQAEMKGWVKRLGVGTYTVSASCPGSTDSEKTPNAAPLSAADNGDDVEVVPTGNANAIAELKHQLAEACKKRDRYRTNENETLMNIEQSRIDRLEGQIAALES